MRCKWDYIFVNVMGFGNIIVIREDGNIYVE
jgi:hypothetical protein